MSLRPTLGDFSSIICFRALVTGTEEALGAAAAGVTLKAAGRKRGKVIVKSLGLSNSNPDPGKIVATLNAAIGADGTKLCIVDEVQRIGDGGFLVKLSETICSAGEPQGSERQLTFTLGAIHGAVEELYGVKIRGKQTESVLRGGKHDAITFEAA